MRYNSDKLRVLFLAQPIVIPFSRIGSHHSHHQTNVDHSLTIAEYGEHHHRQVFDLLSHAPHCSKEYPPLDFPKRHPRLRHSGLYPDHRLGRSLQGYVGQLERHGQCRRRWDLWVPIALEVRQHLLQHNLYSYRPRLRDRSGCHRQKPASVPQTEGLPQHHARSRCNVCLQPLLQCLGNFWYPVLPQEELHGTKLLSWHRNNYVLT
jgi:hypothetical protein